MCDAEGRNGKCDKTQRGTVLLERGTAVRHAKLCTQHKKQAANGEGVLLGPEGWRWRAMTCPNHRTELIEAQDGEFFLYRMFGRGRVIVMTEPNRTFPILWPYARREIEEWTRSGCPRAVPWALIAPHELRAMRTHEQTLERLAERGGLSPTEALAVLTDRDVFDVLRTTSHAEAIERLKRIVERFDQTTRSEEK